MKQKQDCILMLVMSALSEMFRVRNTVLKVSSIEYYTSVLYPQRMNDDDDDRRKSPFSIHIPLVDVSTKIDCSIDT